MIAVALAVVIGIVAYQLHERRAREAALYTAPSPATRPSGTPATQPATLPKGTAPAEEKKPFESTYMDVVRAVYPAMPTTQPLPVPLDLGQAARFTIKDPVYLSRLRADLWVTRAGAPPTRQVLHDVLDPNAADPQTHVLTERVRFVHWMPSDSGRWLPYLVCEGTDGAQEVVWETGRAKLPTPRDFRWDHAFSWNSDVVAPSRTGISVFHFGTEVTESFHELIPETVAASRPAGAPEPQALFDWKGLLAWVPWEKGAVGSRATARYVEGKWSDLGPEQGWPKRVVYLTPLRDGTVFQFAVSEDAAITVQTAALDQPPVDEPGIRKLVAQLDDVDNEVRHKALADLSDFGPGAWPLLERLGPGAPPQARLLIRQLLKDKDRPTLSGMTLLGTRALSVVSHLDDGGVVFYAEQGVSIPEADDQTTTIAPAWLAVRPGHFIELLPPALVADLKPDACKLEVVADQWIVNSDADGPRLFYGNGFAKLLRKDEQQFSRVMGMDQMGRWLFREPAAEKGAGARTLIIDPHLPDPTPRLPVWQLAIAETAGWDTDNWPAVKNGSVYALTEGEWKQVEKDESFVTRLAAPAATQSADAPLLKARDGTRFYNGLTEIRAVSPSGAETRWPLPDVANGAAATPWLIESPDGKLFLFNQSGRLLRIARTPRDAQPFKLEATFTHNIPDTDKPTRVWLDPAGRIDIVWGNRLAICFPAGYIPQPIMQKITDRSGLDAEGL